MFLSIFSSSNYSTGNWLAEWLVRGFIFISVLITSRMRSCHFYESQHTDFPRSPFIGDVKWMMIKFERIKHFQRWNFSFFFPSSFWDLIKFRNSFSASFISNNLKHFRCSLFIYEPIKCVMVFEEKIQREWHWCASQISNEMKMRRLQCHFCNGSVSIERGTIESNEFIEGPWINAFRCSLNQKFVFFFCNFPSKWKFEIDTIIHGSTFHTKSEFRTASFRLHLKKKLKKIERKNDSWFHIDHVSNDIKNEQPIIHTQLTTEYVIIIMMMMKKK